MKKIYPLLSCFMFMIATTSFAQHTFSIVAVDEATGQVGTAGATCLTSADCGGCGGAVIIAGIRPGLGCLNAQATVCIPNVNGNNGMTQMIGGSSAEEIKTWLLMNDACQFGGINDRQYGIALLNSNGEAEAASYTGTGTLSFADHITGPNYSIQGNILIGMEVLEGMEQGFLNTQGSLAEKLMAAMQGANIPGADSRCLPDGISSKSSFLKVAKADDPANDIYLDLLVPNTINLAEPIDSLQSLFNAWQVILANEELQEISNISIFPNPVFDKLNIEISNELLGKHNEIKFFNELGQELHSLMILTQHVSIDVSKFADYNGLLIYKLASEGILVDTGKLFVNKVN